MESRKNASCIAMLADSSAGIFFKKITVQLFKYFWVSLTAAVADFSLFILLFEWIGVQYIISNTVAFSAGLVVNYVFSIKFVFRNESSRSVSEFLIFSIIGLVGLAISNASLFVAIEAMGLGGGVSKLFSLCATFFWNFFARKLILFNKK